MVVKNKCTSEELAQGILGHVAHICVSLVQVSEDTLPGTMKQTALAMN